MKTLDQLQIIIFVEGSDDHDWLVDLINYLTDSEIRVILVTWNKKGTIHGTLHSNPLVEAISMNNNLLNLMSIFKYVNRNFWTSIYSLGHKPSIIALLLKLLIRKSLTINYVQQTNFFELMQESDRFWERVKGTIHEFISKIYFRHSSFVQSVSKDTEDKLLAIGVKVSRIVDIPLGIPDSFQGWSELSQAIELESYSNYEPYILSIGRLAWEKNHVFTIEVFKELLREKSEFTLLIAGGGPLRDDLQRIINIEGLAGKVVLLGFRSDVPALLKRCALFVHSSLTEGYASVQMEARLMCKPQVSTAVGVALDMEQSSDPLVATYRDLKPREVSKLWLRMLGVGETGNTGGWEYPNRIYRHHRSSEVYLRLMDHFLRTST